MGFMRRTFLLYMSLRLTVLHHLCRTVVFVGIITGRATASPMDLSARSHNLQRSAS